MGHCSEDESYAGSVIICDDTSVFGCCTSWQDLKYESIVNHYSPAKVVVNLCVTFSYF
jgi:hypothetical protein